MGEPKFTFYEVVKVKCSVGVPEIAGRTGVVMGIAHEEGYEVIGYSLFFEGMESYVIDEEYLVSTGRFMRREDFYSGESIRVDMNGNLLEGP
jgi:hypothetical protein